MSFSEGDSIFPTNKGNILNHHEKSVIFCGVAFFMADTVHGSPRPLLADGFDVGDFLKGKHARDFHSLFLKLFLHFSNSNR